jgi:hypothetical protein
MNEDEIAWRVICDLAARRALIEAAHAAIEQTSDARVDVKPPEISSNAIAALREDEIAALHWLLGKEASPQPGEPPSKGRAALLRIMRGNDFLNRDLRNALANVLEPIGSSQMRLTLELKKRGRGRPRNYAAQARSLVKDGAAITALDGKPYLAVEDFSRTQRTGKARAHKAYRTYQRAKAVREGQ